MQCPHCNASLRDNAKFCNNCGRALAEGSPLAGARPTAPIAEANAAFVSAGLSAPANAPAARLPGKAVPTGPMFPPREAALLPSAGEAEALPGASAQAEAPARAAGAAPTPPTADEEALPRPPPPPFFSGAPGESRSPGQAADALPSPSTPSVDLDERDDNSTGGPPVMEGTTQPAPENQSDPDDVQATILRPRPVIDIAVTPAVLETLGDYEALRPGMVLKDRYRVEEVLHESVEENLYRVSDKRGYLHCWACGAIYSESRDPDPYCPNCGADMLNKPYRLREHVHTGEATQPDLATPLEEATQARLQAKLQSEPQAEALPQEAALSEGSAKPVPPGASSAEGDETTEPFPPIPPPPPDLATPPTNQAEQQDWPTQPMRALDSFIIGPRHYHVEALEDEQPVFPLGVTLVSGARSDVGLTRRGNPNEDSILVMHLSRIHESLTQPFGLYIVADGLGGHDDGQAASKKAIGVIAERITRDLLLPALQAGAFPESEEIGAKLKGAIEAANLALVEANEQARSDMGSTVTGALVVGETAYIVNVGDSRTYLYDTISLRPISVDHSLVMQLVIGKLIERDDIYTHPQRNQILRSLGDRRDLPVDLFVEKLRPDYQLVICCDGLWEMIRDPEIEKIVRETADPQKAADLLMQTANDNGGEDNISVIVVQARK